MIKKIFIIGILLLLILGNVNADLTTNLDAYYELDETSGTTAVDEISADNGTANTADVFTSSITGIINTGADFTAGNNYIYNDSLVDVYSNDEFTISTWVNLDSYSGAVWLFGKTNDSLLGIFADNSSGNKFRVYGYGQIYESEYTSSTYGTGEWIHLVFRASDTDYNLWINNSLAINSAWANPLSTHGETMDKFTFGARRRSGIDSYLDGSVDEAGLWKRQLTNTEIGYLYNSGLGLAYPFTTESITADFNYEIDKENEQVILEDTSTVVGAVSITDWNWSVNGTLVSNLQDYNYSTTQLTDLNVCLFVDTNTTDVNDTQCYSFNTGDWEAPTTTFTSNQIVGTTDQNIILTCTDNNSGCEYINFRINNGDWNYYLIGDNPLTIIYSGAGDHNIQYFSTDNADNNEAINTSTFSTYGVANFTFYDENSSTLLNDITYTISPSINGDSGATLTDTNTFDLNLQGITNTTYTFTFTKTGYGTRYYVTDLNQYSELDINFALLPTSLSISIPLKVYQTNQSTLFTNTYVEMYLPDTNWIVGKRKTNSSGETTFSLHTTDQNYYANVNEGQFTYQPVALTILYPKNEDTLEQITELWKLEITQNLFVSYTDLNAEKIIYLLPNTADAFNIKISDMNDNYFSRTYAKQYPGNPLTDSLQPYLVPIDTGLLTTINTISSYTNQPVPFITIKIYKNIASIGRTLVEQIVTDSKGQALTLLNLNEEYEFEIYDSDLEFIRTDTITSTSSTIYVKIDIIDFTDPELNQYYITQAFIPTRTKLITTDTSLTQTTTLNNYGTNVLISQIDYWVTNTDQNNSGTDVNIYTNTITPNALTYTNTIDINQENNTLDGVFYDYNGLLIVNIKVTLDDGNIFYYSFEYKPRQGFDWLYNAGIGLRTIFGCTSTDPNIPCPIMMGLALFLSILITISLAMSTGFTNMEGMGFIMMAILGMFTYFGWMPPILYGIILIGMIVISVALGGKRI